MVTKLVIVTQRAAVTVDESKFTEQFMKEFREQFYPFTTLDDHIEHIGQMYIRGVEGFDGFIEGYGPASDMGIKVEIERDFTEVEIVSNE